MNPVFIAGRIHRRSGESGAGIRTVREGDRAKWVTHPQGFHGRLDLLSHLKCLLKNSLALELRCPRPAPANDGRDVCSLGRQRAGCQAGRGDARRCGGVNSERGGVVEKAPLTRGVGGRTRPGRERSWQGRMGGVGGNSTLPVPLALPRLETNPPVPPCQGGKGHAPDEGLLKNPVLGASVFPSSCMATVSTLTLSSRRRSNATKKGAVEKAFVKGATPLSPLVRGVKAMPPDEGVEEKPP